MISGCRPTSGLAAPQSNSIFEYGPRSGCWRLMRIFKRFDIKISVLGVVRALEQCPELTQAFVADGHEIVSHGYRWLDYLEIDEKTEREHIRLAVAGIEQLTGQAPVGWFNGRPSNNTRRLLVEHGGFLYDRDYLGDELPFWVRFGKRQPSRDPDLLRDQRQSLRPQFWLSLRRRVCALHDGLFRSRSTKRAPSILKMMAINLHDRLIGRPAKAVGLIKFLESMRASATECGFAPAARSRSIGAAKHPPAVIRHDGIEPTLAWRPLHRGVAAMAAPSRSCDCRPSGDNRAKAETARLSRECPTIPGNRSPRNAALGSPQTRLLRLALAGALVVAAASFRERAISRDEIIDVRADLVGGRGD